MNRVVFGAAAAAALIATLAATPAARADEYSPASPPPPLPHDVVTIEQTKPNADLISSGAMMFGIPYAASVIVAASSDRKADTNLYVPIAGPWMDLAGRKERCQNGTCENDTPNRVLLVANGIFQGVGALQVLAGFMFPTRETVTRAAGIHVRPDASLHHVGLAAYGAF